MLVDTVTSLGGVPRSVGCRFSYSCSACPEAMEKLQASLQLLIRLDMSLLGKYWGEGSQPITIQPGLVLYYALRKASLLSVEGSCTHYSHQQSADILGRFRGLGCTLNESSASYQLGNCKVQRV